MVAILMVLAIPLVAILGGILVAVVKVLRGGEKGGSLPAEEARMMQEIHQGLERLEQRLASLETIVFDEKSDDEQTAAKPPETGPSEGV